MEAESDRPSWLIEPLGKHHDRADFSCGNDALDRYLKSQAGQDARRHVAAPFVAVPAAGSRAVLGYYTLSAFGVELTELPDETAKKLPGYPVVPAALLGRLAVDHRHRGRGLGEFLLTDALYRTYAQASQIAAAAVVVEALDEQAARFYRHFDFIPFPGRQDRLFLPMRAVATLFRSDRPAP